MCVAVAALVVGVGVVLAGGDEGGDRDQAAYAPHIDPARFSNTVDNPFLPLLPGSRWVYEGRVDEGFVRKVVEVTSETRQVMGVTCVVVRDVVHLDGRLHEDTVDWYAQDAGGNVWNFGEETKKFDNGAASAKGSWEAGVDGAQPGVVMKAYPKVGDRYRQEYKRGEAEDMAGVVSVTERAVVPFRPFDHMLMTKDFSPLDPGALEHKYYAGGVGLVLEVIVKGGQGRVELVEMTRS